jgi:lysophospholipase L1-like esterase
MLPMRKSLVLFALALGLLALLLPPAGAATALRGDYVALGDSYTAGPAIPNQDPAAGQCYRSDHNYPHLIAPSVAPTAFRDASCSGAQTNDMTQTQAFDVGPSNPPQFDRLNSSTRLVTLGISGNDIGFVSILENCASPTPTGHPCQDKYVVNGNDELRQRIADTAPKVAAVLQGIRARSPKARILVVGYPAILPDTGSGCWPQMPVAPDDVPYLRGIEKALNGMLASTAAANRATYVDTYTPSIGHDACQPLTINRWVEPVVPNQPAAPVHPNAAGEQGMADAVLATLGR